MSVTKEEYAAFKARKGRARLQPVKAEGDLLAIFAAGKLVNPLNAYDKWVYRLLPRYKREWHDRVAMALLEAGMRTVTYERRVIGMDYGGRVSIPSKTPKHVTILGNTHGRMDRDGLYASLKPVIDALVKAGVIDDDAELRDGVGHVIECDQQIDRKNRGVTVRVRLRTPPPTTGR